MKTDTPRTDEVAWPETGLVEGDFARQLERELAAAREEITILKSKYADHHAEAERLTSEIRSVAKQRDRLAEALKIDPYPDEPISDDLHGGNVYCEISVGEMRKIREALQSLTTNKL